jgi:hypothetical protein
MDRERTIERILWAAAVFNLGGMMVFAFPESVGQLAGMPVPVPRVHSALLAAFVLIFAGMYAWAASDREVRRPLVWLGAIGKASAFTVVLVCWLLGEASSSSLGAMSIDLVFAALFAWWLVGEAGARVPARA